MTTLAPTAYQTLLRPTRADELLEGNTLLLATHGRQDTPPETGGAEFQLWEVRAAPAAVGDGMVRLSLWSEDYCKPLERDVPADALMPVTSLAPGAQRGDIGDGGILLVPDML